MPAFIDLSGQKFGILKVKKRTGNINSRTIWVCDCECGNKVKMRSDLLLTGRRKSCGCLAKSKNRKSTYRNYKMWCNIKTRCYNKNSYDYRDYGGRGIHMCDDWLNSYEAFRDWSYKNGYSSKSSIDRINVNGNYEPNNCRFVDIYTQANNKRDNVFFEYDNRNQTLGQWAREYNITYKILWQRVNKYHMPLKKALLTGDLRR